MTEDQIKILALRHRLIMTTAALNYALELLRIRDDNPEGVAFIEQQAARAETTIERTA